MKFLDLLFAKYAQPMFLLDKMILTGRFAEFIDEFIAIHNQEQRDRTSWEYYVHRVFNMSFQDYIDSLPGEPKQDYSSDEVLSATVGNSAVVLFNFDPCQQ